MLGSPPCLPELIPTDEITACLQRVGNKPLLLTVKPSALPPTHGRFRFDKGDAMNTARGMALVTLMALAASPAFAFNLNDAANAVSNATSGNQKATAAPEAAGLLNMLGSQLNVTPEQAVGGTGALLGLAKNKLTSADYSQLSKSVPGLEQLSGTSALESLGGANGLGSLLGGNSANNSMLNSALGNVQNMGDVNTAFKALGMDSTMVSQFAPLILQYLGQQGASGSALQSLSGLWGAGS
ncbi:hypothetical protein ALQ08_04260 [Pseudomonas syringae pv. delphinii]|uniref:DUF2780 domain-containing protein n=4 Tax=Pseudomonas syringae group genomosp. 3 TaxID=251701 RepID=A0A3M4KIL8_9PSED|nr:hypothetical protein ALQ08_04260 [Pseudomonas syringae pv. delphinii]